MLCNTLFLNLCIQQAFINYTVYTKYTGYFTQTNKLSLKSKIDRQKYLYLHISVLQHALIFYSIKKDVIRNLFGYHFMNLFFSANKRPELFKVLYFPAKTFLSSRLLGQNLQKGSENGIQIQNHKKFRIFAKTLNGSS